MYQSLHMQLIKSTYKVMYMTERPTRSCLLSMFDCLMLKTAQSLLKRKRTGNMMAQSVVNL